MCAAPSTRAVGVHEFFASGDREDAVGRALDGRAPRLTPLSKFTVHTPNGAFVTFGATEVATRTRVAGSAARGHAATVNDRPGVISLSKDGTPLSTHEPAGPGVTAYQQLPCFKAVAELLGRHRGSGGRRPVRGVRPVADSALRVSTEVKPPAAAEGRVSRRRVPRGRRRLRRRHRRRRWPLFSSSPPGGRRLRRLGVRWSGTAGPYRTVRQAGGCP